MKYQSLVNKAPFVLVCYRCKAESEIKFINASGVLLPGPWSQPKPQYGEYDCTAAVRAALPDWEIEKAFVFPNREAFERRAYCPACIEIREAHALEDANEA